MSEYYAVVRSTDHLAHYGVKGMKWGVRRALSKGNERALDRNFRRAARKLKKLTDIGLNSKKYAAKAVAYGAAAAGTGTVAVMGTSGYTSKLKKKAASLAKNALYAEAAASGKKDFEFIPGKDKFKSEAAKQLVRESNEITEKARKIDEWGNYRKKVSTSGWSEKIDPETGKVKLKYTEGPDKEVGLSRNQKLRIAAGVATAGLGAASAVNAYRATHSKKYRQKAVAYKNAMDEVFSGTKYEGKYVAEPRQRKKKKRR